MEREKVAADARAEEQSRKRRWQIAAAGVVVLALVGGILGLGLYLRAEARANADLATKNAELAAANKRERERFNLAADAIGLFTGDVSEDLLLKQKEFAALRSKLLKGAVDFYGKLEAQLKDQNDPESQAVLARAYFELGELTDEIGSKTEALEVHRKALAIRRTMAAASGADMETRFDLTRSLRSLGRLLEDTDDLAGSLAVAEEQRSIVTALDGESPTDPVRAILAQSHHEIGRMLFSTGKLPEALESWQQARAIRQKLSDAHPEDAESQISLAESYHGISLALAYMGRPAEGLESCRAARALLQKLVDANPAVPRYQFKLAMSSYATGRQFRLMARPSTAITNYQMAKTIFNRLAKDHPAVSDFQNRLANCDLQIGEMQYKTGRPSEALASLQSARAIRQKLADDQTTALTHRIALLETDVFMAGALRNLGRQEEAKTSYRSAVALADALVRDPPVMPEYRGNMAYALGRLALGRLADGDASANEIRRALTFYEALPTWTGEACFEMACCHAALSALAGRKGSSIAVAEGPAASERALAELRRAVDMAYRDAEAFRSERALDSLRKQTGFLQLLGEIDAFNRAELADQK
jgi:tetratricopeptide (TPR) repeat protein